MPKVIVISAIALRSGGTLSILQDCLQELRQQRYADYEIYVVIKDRALVTSAAVNVHFIEIDGTGSYIRRLYYEYVYFRKLSRKLMPDLWISMHDITPNVKARKRVVYCHNPSLFYKPSLRETLLDPKFWLFTRLYWLLYRINIRQNDFVVVQQKWIREDFARMFKVREEQIIVSYPNISYSKVTSVKKVAPNYTFLYPVFPRVFKNIEIIGEAVKLLQEKKVDGFQVIITIDGTENWYAWRLKKKYGHLAGLQFIGNQPRGKIFELYTEADALIFPSRLETWGLPISEFKQTGKPALLADLPYAHETAGTYSAVVYFSPVDPDQLAEKMEKMITNKTEFMPAANVDQVPPPFANDWKALFEIIVPD